MDNQRYIADANYGSPDRERVPIDFDPRQYDTPEDAAKAFHKALRATVTAYGQNPDTECFILTPEQARKRGVGNNWQVSWEAGPWEWGIVASAWVNHPAGKWYTEPYYSFDLCFTE